MVAAADMCNFLLRAVQQMVKQCHGQLATCDLICEAGRCGNDQVYVGSHVLNDLRFNASFIRREGWLQILLWPLTRRTHVGIVF